MTQVKRAARRAFVEASDCVACGCCVKVCPKSAIRVAHGITAVVDSVQAAFLVRLLSYWHDDPTDLQGEERLWAKRKS